MSSNFLNQSVNYSETNELKIKLLKPLLENYNKFVLKNNDKNFNDNLTYFIPNNNKKYYMFVVNKNSIKPNFSLKAINKSNDKRFNKLNDKGFNKVNDKYLILYFFSEDLECDFFIEMDKHNSIFIKENYLFEGYLYNQENFLITDVLIVSNNIVDCEYSLRNSLINELIECPLKLNGHFNISIHPTFHIENKDQLYGIFKNNFIFKNEINCIELIGDSNPKKIRHYQPNLIENDLKLIEKGKYTDIYFVYNIESNDNEGILYIKTISDSKKLRELSYPTQLNCSFNIKFNKWEVIIS